ncbi:hypothetical protein IDJ81_13730 [Tsuneonella flava]|uniref:Uncharacterized protein n=1 Tax=Tsuneonella flava TaxID=2055955 RepID=A0ABX7KDT2_9SPHN|nr:hypothetical protein [Tsuneonella flava]QSB46249.1 hypothetical protein IDJ81_13730 [Tsuneonella flava]
MFVVLLIVDPSSQELGPPAIPGRFIILAAHTDDLRVIERAGFRRDGNEIYLPIEFDIKKIADGLRNDDLAEAMEPVVRAAKALLVAGEAFQRLRDAMVAKANS